MIFHTCTSCTYVYIYIYICINMSVISIYVSIYSFSSLLANLHSAPAVRESMWHWLRHSHQKLPRVHRSPGVEQLLRFVYIHVYICIHIYISIHVDCTHIYIIMTIAPVLRVVMRSNQSSLVTAEQLVIGHSATDLEASSCQARIENTRI